VEKLANRAKTVGRTERSRPSETKDADTRALEADLSAALGSPVTINHDQKAGGGKIIDQIQGFRRASTT
jgi:ParB family chromosome partitioning protein